MLLWASRGLCRGLDFMGRGREAVWGQIVSARCVPRPSRRPRISPSDLREEGTFKKGLNSKSPFNRILWDWLWWPGVKAWGERRFCLTWPWHIGIFRPRQPLGYILPATALVSPSWAVMSNGCRQASVENGRLVEGPVNFGHCLWAQVTQPPGSLFL